jgi:uncharacterized protein
MINKFITYVMLVMAVVTGSAAFAAESISEIKVPELTGQAVFLTKENISKDEQQKIISALQNLETQSKVQMAVLVVDSIKPFTIEEYSIKVAEKWKIGKVKEDNGLILVVATQDHKARLEVGYGMEGKITDAISSRILKDYVTPEFKQKNWYGGIMQAIGRVENIAQGKQLDAAVSPNITSASKAKQSSSSGWWKMFHDADGEWLIVLVVIFLFAGLFITHIGHLILTGIVVGSIAHSLGKDINNILTSVVSAIISGIFAYYVLHGAWYISIISGAIFGAIGIKWFFEFIGDILGSSGGGGGFGGGFSSSSSSSDSFSGGGGSFGGGGSSSDW